MRLVVALGGNALLRRGEPPEARLQQGRAAEAAGPSARRSRSLEAAVVAELLEAGVVVCCAGGGGVPVARGADGRLHGVEAVIDKDLASAVLAESIGADLLLLLTDVPGVLRDHGTARARLLERVRRVDVTDLDLPRGSMRPKAEAALRFVERTGGRAVIGDVADVLDLAAGRTGTAACP